MCSCPKSQSFLSRSGPGYPNPTDAFLNGSEEKLLFVSTVSLKASVSDCLAVVDVDSKSPTYCQVVAKCSVPNIGDELHHFGWNSCSSCYGDSGCVRNKIILPCLNSDRIYVIEVGWEGDVASDTRLKIVKIIENLREKLKVSVPHTVHCSPDKNIMISCMGDENGDGQGSLIVLDGEDFSIKSFWTQDKVKFGYDFWYQPRFNVLITSEWGSPKAWKKGFHLADVNEREYGHHIHIYDWTTKRLKQSIDLGEKDGCMPLEVRFMHNPDKAHGFVGCALSSSIFHIHKNGLEWQADKVIQVPTKKVENWMLDSMPGVITDILLSMDDKFLYFSNWIHGDVRQYNIRNPSSPIHTGSIFIGGSLCNDTRIKVKDGNLVERLEIKGKKLRGGPQMLQLSLDGKRLYVTNSLYSEWDSQFYPELSDKGSMMARVLVDHCEGGGGLKLDESFLIDFGGAIEDGPFLAHEMRYPGGDCTSDIWC
ncbi:methanethiol oxidase [Brevipalpus obovatus]|uniref:methanethiol oxidase n=1 Tax=Brevipalpus obovatus TaxID=246614 RepID=UPI003D9E4D83